MSWQQFKQQYLVKFWAPLPAVIAAGILSTYYFGLTGTFWAVTGEFTRWGGQLLQLMGVHAEEWGYFKIIHLEGSPLTRIDGMMIIGMFGGCFAAALWANNVKLRKPQHRIRILQAVAGGIIAGFGARLAMGCNLAAFFTGIPQFSLHAWFFAIATAIGSWFGARFTLMPIFRIPVKLQKVSSASQLTQNHDQARRRFRIGMLIFVGMIGWALLTAMNQPKLGLAMLFGVGFGLLIERAQICFTSAFRDMWITGRTHMAKAIILGMAVSAIGIFSYVQLGAEPKIMWAGPNAVLGGLLFGFGIVLAGGCETGWMYRAVEGQMHYWWVGLGNVIGSTILAYFWDDLSPALATSWDKINLLNTFGPLGGLLVTYLMLFAALMLIIGWEKHFFRRSRTLNTETAKEGV
ncbi:selenium metabolism membrane protein YedE/FdhT [Atlantibacter subterraneus]|uniref:Selenium metabolism membrane protein YedE/FdhT n=1 Tax=Atlantibacter subterraneus TaxID=255519 RepID=A0A427UXL8_9ENTR|nr:selenium metabolism membrane protein YedE/FdhT [Atlantibacter subterranea]MDZ5668708.1 selenium metabolism membrane protein YedE/FdhT [Atlantibacter hermannii]MDA3133116.1 selenium metabolism membrane protein YedE/FdhT [Atlantibacter subterranea]MDV7021627.1 selenium metabolism membrane protein YedE/FdhT [Atlantibacter subterranea]RSB65426.1 YeeE/YedE family protein [Atlantibacter subterranea]RSE08518.1 YeeE/YedE family protein [Atlantibacter subterranea]